MPLVRNVSCIVISRRKRLFFPRVADECPRDVAEACQKYFSFPTFFGRLESRRRKGNSGFYIKQIVLNRKYWKRLVEDVVSDFIETFQGSFSRPLDG